MRKKIAVISAVLVFSAVVAYAGAWMTNRNHHIQVRIPVGWNTEYEVMQGPEGKQAHLIVANDAEDEDLSMVAAIASIEMPGDIDLEVFKKFLEEEVLKDAVVIESQERGFNNLPGLYVIYDAEFGGKMLRLMCFYTKHAPYYYAIFTGTLKDDFEAKKMKLDEILVTVQYVE